MEIEKYYFLIDESGDEGLNKIKTHNSGGADPWLILSSVMVKKSDISECGDFIKNWLNSTLCVFLEQ